MPTAIIGSLDGSSAQDVGKPTVNPSTERPTICVAPACTPALARTSLRWTPVQSVLPMRSPPTVLLTHASVTYCSKSGIATSSG